MAKTDTAVVNLTEWFEAADTGQLLDLGEDESIPDDLRKSRVMALVIQRYYARGYRVDSLSKDRQVLTFTWKGDTVNLSQSTAEELVEKIMQSSALKEMTI